MCRTASESVAREQCFYGATRTAQAPPHRVHTTPVPTFDRYFEARPLILLDSMAIALAHTLHNLNMQTFLPYASFEQTATILDWKRLGKQRLEGIQISKIITTPDYVGAWAHHPAVKMWRGYENALKLYVNTMITEWKRRGYVNTMLYFDLSGVEIIFPEWLGDPRFHDSHKSNLLRKYPEYYSQFHWNVSDDLPYFWPVK